MQASTDLPDDVESLKNLVIAQLELTLQELEASEREIAEALPAPGESAETRTRASGAQVLVRVAPARDGGASHRLPYLWRSAARGG